MKPSSLALFCTLALLPTLTQARPSALPPPGRMPDGVGVNIHFRGAPARDLDGIQRAGFRWIRMDFVWDYIEKTQGVYDFTDYDTLVAGLRSRHIRPLFILDYGNKLYQEGAPRSPQARAAFARFAAAAADHYRGQSIIWEIWNEPNIGFWQPQPNADEYAALAFETARAIKATDPNATVIAPGSSTLPLPFMETLFKTGALRYLDAVSFHPYRGDNPESAAADYAQVRRLIAKYAPGRDVPLVSSEWGYTTASVSEKTQAQYLTRQMLSNMIEGIRVSIWYDWHNDGTNPKEGEHNFGTVRYNYAPKPAYVAARTLTHALDGYQFIKRLSLPSDKDYLLLMRHGSQVRLVAWTTGNPHPVTLPLPGATRIQSLVDATSQTLKAPLQITLSLDGSPRSLTPSATATPALLQAADWTVAARNPSYTSGQPLGMTLTYVNRDSRQHRVGLAVEIAVPGTNTPHRAAIAAAPVTSSQTQRRTFALLGFSRVPVQAQVSLVIDGQRQPYAQTVTWTPTDPITLSAAPRVPSGFAVQVLNPAGTAFRGRLTSNTPGDTGGIPVLLRAGQKMTEVAAPGQTARPTAWTLRDAHGAFVAALPAQRFVPYPVAWDQVQTLRDGDPKLQWDLSAVPSNDGLNVTYRFAPGWAFWRAVPPSQSPLTDKPTGFGLWVRGDGSGNLVRMRFRDATGQTFQPDGVAMNWTGWRWVTFPLTVGGSQHVGSWGGAQDGRIHGAITLDTLFLLDSPSEAKSRQGTVSLRGPSLLYGPK